MPEPIEVFRYLVEHNNPMIYDCRNDGKNARQYYDRGETPPEYLLPGRVVMDLTPEQREILSKLTSDEVSKERY